MIQIYQSHFTTINFNTHASLLKQEWYNTNQMRDQDYKAEMEVFAEKIELYTPVSLLSDMRKFYFPVSPDLQDEVKSRFFPSLMKVNVEKFAILIRSKLLGKISIEQNQHNTLGFTTLFFDQESEARHWLNPELTLQVF